MTLATLRFSRGGIGESLLYLFCAVLVVVSLILLQSLFQTISPGRSVESGTLQMMWLKLVFYPLKYLTMFAVGYAVLKSTWKLLKAAWDLKIRLAISLLCQIFIQLIVSVIALEILLTIRI